MTVRGARLLADADVVVLRPRLGGGAALGATGRGANRRRRAGRTRPAQDALSMLVADKARDGLIVARLKWGDPFVFDSGAKEALFLHEQGVPFEIVPGIPVAIGATAYAGIPLTYPEAGDALVLVRGHEDEAGRVPDLDWESLSRLEGTWACSCGWPTGACDPATAR